MGIDIGADAIDRTYVANNAVYSPCYINGVNPAIVAGRIKLVRFYYKGVPTGYSVVGTFYRTNGNILTSRDYENVATVSGLNERVVDIRVEIGDYIGIRILRAATGNGIALDYDAGWVNDYWRTLAETNFPYTNYAFDNLGKRIVSLYGEIATIPTVTTDPATEVEATAATGNGNITDNGGEDCDKRGFVYDTSPRGDPGDTAPADSEYADYVEETDSFGTGAFTGALSSLEPETTYYVRAYAHNSAGYSYGDEVSFTTLSAIPSVSTNPASAVGQTTATLNGTLDEQGLEACDCSFEYGETTDYGATTATQSKGGGETFSQEVFGLKGGTVYHFRAKATNSVDTSYGADQTFHTEALSAEAHQALGKGYALGRHGL